MAVDYNLKRKIHECVCNVYNNADSLAVDLSKQCITCGKSFIPNWCKWPVEEECDECRCKRFIHQRFSKPDYTSLKGVKINYVGKDTSK